MRTDLKGKIAVITGAGGGIGSILTKELEKEGVIFISIDRQKIFRSYEVAKKVMEITTSNKRGKEYVLYPKKYQQSHSL